MLTILKQEYKVKNKVYPFSKGIELKVSSNKNVEQFSLKIAEKMIAKLQKDLIQD